MMGNGGDHLLCTTVYVSYEILSDLNSYEYQKGVFQGGAPRATPHVKSTKKYLMSCRVKEVDMPIFAENIMQVASCN